MRRRVVVYGDVDLNYIDGSSVWLVSLCAVLESLAWLDVELILKAPIHRAVLTSALGARVRVHEPSSLRSPDEAIRTIVEVDASDPVDAVIVRGRRFSLKALEEPRIASKVWAYLTDVPQDVATLVSPAGDELREILSGCARVLCQTEDMRAWFASIAPDYDSKLLLLPPMVPDDAFRPHPRPWAADGLKLLYAGKFAPGWGFVEMVAQVASLRSRGMDVSLLVAGDKIHDPPEDPDFAPAIRAALAADFVDWRGGVERAEVFRLLDEVDLALSVRDSSLDESREISTKLLEYSAGGVPVVANRTRAHAELFGDDYPLLVDDFSGIAAVVDSIIAAPELFDWAAKRVRDVAAGYSYQKAAEGVAPALEETPPARWIGESGPRLLVAGHDLKFIASLIDDWRIEGYRVEVDKWLGSNRHDPEMSLEMLSRADVVMCEWMLGNADFYARNAPADVPVIVRLHRVEVTTEWPLKVPTDSIEAVVAVSDHMKGELVQAFGFPDWKVTVIPNSVDWVAYRRPKLEGAPFTLGMLGYLPRLKRLDRAIELLIRLRSVDSRYRLVVKGRRPEELNWVWNSPEERSYFEDLRARIREDPDLAQAVVFEGAGADTPSWFRKIGYILSPSDLESFHLALAEGMASGAVPVVWEREGAAEIAGETWIRSTTDAAAEWILENQSRWEDSSREASMLVWDRYRTSRVREKWDGLMRSVTEKSGRSPQKLPAPREAWPPFEELVATESGFLTGPAPGVSLSIDYPYRYVDRPADESDVSVVELMRHGEFQPSRLFDPIPISGVPDWVDNPFQNRTWDFHRHSLEWLEPLIRVAAEDDDARGMLEAIVSDWIRENSTPPGRTPYVWNDHTAAIRARVFLFLLFTLERHECLTESFRRLVLATLVQHGAYLADHRFYAGNSNHGLEMDASLLALAASLPCLDHSDAWKSVAMSRLDLYLRRNYSKRFVHLEQSPAYHLFVTVRLMSLHAFFVRNGIAAPSRLKKVVEGAAAFWPYLRLPDGSAPMIGDTPLFPKPVDFAGVYERLMGRPPRSIAPEDIVNPRKDGAAALVDREAGYAIYSDQPPTVDPKHDRRSLHVVVKCNSFESPHYHFDAGSVVIWADGIHWVVDSGYYSMEEATEERKYMRSARAHNVLLLEGEDFGFRPIEVIDAFRNEKTDGIEIVHELEGGRHRRRVQVSMAQRWIEVHDVVLPFEASLYKVDQLFHLNPALELSIESVGWIEARHPSGRRLTISRRSERGGDLMVASAGDDADCPVSWYSEDYLDRVKSPVVKWETSVKGRFESVVRFEVG